MEAAHFFETPKIILHGVGIQNAMTGLNTPWKRPQKMIVRVYKENIG
jgi:hypothetical protein